MIHSILGSFHDIIQNVLPNEGKLYLYLIKVERTDVFIEQGKALQAPMIFTVDPSDRSIVANLQPPNISKEAQLSDLF